MTQLTLLDCEDPVFPPPSSALTEPDGLLAVGGNLNPKTLIQAYSLGIFPWFEEGQPILWWSPHTRTVLEPGDLHISRSLKKVLRQQTFTITSDQSFAEVIKYCAAPRGEDTGTWITDEMVHAYVKLHQEGHAHSIEVWKDSSLVGGLYGVAVGSVFCGESMFSLVSNASKVALVALGNTLFASGFELIDCQLSNPHLSSMGCKELAQKSFLAKLDQLNKANLEWPHSFFV